jgi:hypothetical protein
MEWTTSSISQRLSLCHTELDYAQAIEIAHIVATGECEIGRGANQIGNLHRSGTTR